MNKCDIAYGFSRVNDVEVAVRQASIQVRERLSSSYIDTCLVLFNLSEDKTKNLPYVIKRILNPEKIIGFNLPLLIAGTQVFRNGLIIITFSGVDIITGVSSEYGDALELSEKFVWKILKDSGSMRKSYFLSFSELDYLSCSKFLRGIERGMGKNTYLTGVISCKELAQASLIYNESIVNNCSVGMLFSDGIDSFAEVGSGFSPLGKGGRITSYYKNQIKQIDNKPAITFYSHYFGDKVVKDHEYYKAVTMRYPLGFKTPYHNDYIIARPLRLNRDGSLELIKEVVSEDVKLMIPTRRLLMKSLQNSCRNLITSMKNPKICVVFDSFFRYKLLGTSYSKQLRLAGNVLGRIPLVGGIPFCNLGSASLSKIESSHFIWENSFLAVGWGGKQ